MLVRIVKMSFDKEQIDVFLDHFNKNKNKIRNFEGCLLLELYRDNAKEHVYFTYSYWQKEQDLMAYRNSELFHNIWSKTKLLFNSKPEAWSVTKIDSLI